MASKCSRSCRVSLFRSQPPPSPPRGEGPASEGGEGLVPVDCSTPLVIQNVKVVFQDDEQVGGYGFRMERRYVESHFFHVRRRRQGYNPVLAAIKRYTSTRSELSGFSL